MQISSQLPFYNPSNNNNDTGDKANREKAGVPNTPPWTPQVTLRLLQTVYNTPGLKSFEEIANVVNQTAEDCKKKYFSIIEADVKTGSWTKEEDTLLLEGVREVSPAASYDHWDMISKAFFGGTRRPTECEKRHKILLKKAEKVPTPAAAPVTIPTHDDNPKKVPPRTDGPKKASWTAEEDQLLTDAVVKDKMSWSHIAKVVFNDKYTPFQCRYRYQNHLDKSVDRGPWISQEETLLKDAAIEYKLDWKAISEKVFKGKRLPEQCSKRYLNISNPAIATTPWDKEDDKLLLNAVEKHKKDWDAICIEVFAGRRSPSQCRDRYTNHFAHAIITTAWTEEEDKQLKEAAEKYNQDWAEISITVFKALRSPLKCSQRYLNHLAPTVNNGHWQEEEDTRLVEAIQKYNSDWQLIAKEAFQSKRTPEHCQERFQHHLDPAINWGPWTKEEDELLKQAAEKHNKDWAVISREVFQGKRTPDYCSRRYKLRLDPTIVKGHWSDEDDKLLKEAAEKFEKDWSKISTEIFQGKRTAEQCQRHYQRSLDPKINRLPWTEADDTLLKAAHEKHKGDWKDIAKELEQLNRTPYHCKRRFVSLTAVPKIKIRWDEADDLLLKNGIENHQQDWEAISREVFNGRRSSDDCQKRHQKLNPPPGIILKWKEEEDQALRDGVALHGAQNWAAISREFLDSTRTAQQCRMRYCNHLDPKLKKGAFTQEQDEILNKAIEEYGKNWDDISKKAFNGTRSVDQCKRRHQSILMGIEFKKLGASVKPHYENSSLEDEEIELSFNK